MRLELVASEDEKATIGYGTAVNVFLVLSKVFDTILAKNISYGDAWRSQGWMGNLARIMSKTSRLKNMLWQPFNTTDAKEPVEDTAADLIAILAFFLINYTEENRWGN